MTVDLLLLLVKTGVVMGLLYGLFAYGLSLILSVNKVFHVAQGATFVVSAYVFHSLSIISALPQFIALLITLIAAGIFGVAMELLIYRPLVKRGANPMVILVASLLLVTFSQYWIELIWGAGVLSTPAPTWFEHSWSLWGLRVDAYDLSVILVSLLVFVGMHWFLTRTRPGLEFRAVGDNPERAEALAINLNRVFIRSMVLGSMLVVPAAVILSLRAPIHSHMGFDLLLKAVVALTIGGMGRMSGALVGGVLVGLAEALPPYWLPTEWGEFTLYIIAFVFVLVRPNGLLGGPRTGRRPALFKALTQGRTKAEVEPDGSSSSSPTPPQPSASSNRTEKEVRS